MMDCKRIDELLVEYLYQELDPSQVEHFEAHLQVCSRCAQELSSYERTRAAVQDLGEVDPPPQLTEALLKEAARAVEPQPIGFWDRVRDMFRLVVMHPAMTAAVTLVLVLGVSFYVYRQGPPRGMRGGSIEPETPLRTEIDRPLPETATSVTKPSAALPAGPEGETAEQGGLSALRSAENRAVARAERGAGRAVAQRRMAKRASASARVADEENYSRGLRPTTASKAMEPSLEPVAARERQEKAPADTQQAPSADLDVNKQLPAPAKQAGYVGQSQGSYGGGKLGKLANASPATTAPKPRAKSAPELRGKYKASAADDLLDGLDTGNAVGDKAAFGKGASRDAAETSKKRADQSLSGDRIVVKGKYGKGRATQGKPRVAARPGPGTAAYWREQGDKAAAAGLCSAALSYYNRAVELNKKLLAAVTPKVRTCASAMARGGEAALAAAQKTNPQLSAVLGVELERSRRTEAKGGAAGERVRQQQQASPRRAVRAKAAPTQAIDNAAK